MSDVEHEVHLKARDHGRIPIAREASERNAGFSGTTSALWTPMNLDADVCSVAAQDKRTDSVLNFRWKMLAFRKQHTETLVFGDFEPLSPDDSTVFAYWQKAVLQNTNMGWQIKDAMILRSGLYVSLSAFEGMVVECDAQ
jgi:glycosidase